MRFRRRRKPELPEHRDPPAQPSPAQGDPDPVDTWFRYCPVCGSLAAGGYVLHMPQGVKGMCHSSRGVDCKSERVSMRRAMAVTGMSEEAVLIEVYAHISNPDNPMRNEAATRLGMAPPQPAQATFEETQTDSVPVALHTLVEQAVPATPVIDEPRLRAEFRSVAKAWSSRGLWSGTVVEATDILRVNLERDLRRQGFRHFAVGVIPDGFCAQISTLYAGVFTGYRIWRTAGRLHFCGGQQAILGYDSPDAHGGRAAMWHNHGLLPRPHAGAATGNEALTSQLLDELFAIAVLRGFLSAGAADARTRAIGTELKRMGGLHSMRQAHAVVYAELGPSHARQLEMAWDGVGAWLG
ncbi:hypothetical protein SUDANB15_07139 [Streptomyces sp. enrichment culture]|uniref:hypothetical protein n=1 Tax=Streptomyces sp. enrichment culture TaxID=1795815 RepID=UPI003F576625